jgi:hypothetical protein
VRVRAARHGASRLRCTRCAGTAPARRAPKLDASQWSGRRLVIAVACGPCATAGPPDLQADVVLLRYLDVCLVLATAPFVLVGGMPTVGYLIGAGAWVLTRAATALLHGQARRAGEAKVRAGLLVAALLGRVWLIAAAVILARYAGSKDDGIMAAVLVLAAFTVYLTMSFITREGPIGSAPHTRGRPSVS